MSVFVFFNEIYPLFLRKTPRPVIKIEKYSFKSPLFVLIEILKIGSITEPCGTSLLIKNVILISYSPKIMGNAQNLAKTGKKLAPFFLGKCCISKLADRATFILSSD